MLIGITTTQQTPDRIERVTLEYLDCVEAQGAIPVLLPPVDPAEAPELLDRLDGVILAGGGDIDPPLYGDASRLDETSDVLLKRDLFELELAKRAHEQDIPLFGICRGIQVVNVALGGTLHQDVRVCGLTTRDHKQDPPFDQADQSVEVVPGTRLAALYEQAGLPLARMTNSIHHQAVKEVAPMLQVSATSSDGIVEGLEDPTKRFYIAVQWHPEYLPQDCALFAGFCKACEQ